MGKPNALVSALRSSGARVAAEPVEAEPLAPAAVRPAVGSVPRYRQGTKPIRLHQPIEVHQQLKMLAAEQNRFMDDLVAEALNLLFARYRKPEIAPRKSAKGQ